jgi:hypothetical protein
MSYLYSKLPETGVSPPIGTGGGERLWYALHGYDVQAPPSGRGMYGHGRVLPPDHRTPDHAKAASRLLLVKAARRMRRDGWNAGRVWLWLELMGDASVYRDAWLPAVHDDQAVLSALERMWDGVRLALPRRPKIMRIGVTLLDLTRASGSNLTLESRMGFPSDLPNVVVGFQAAISRFVAEANDDPKPFTWLADPNKSIVAVRRGYQVLDSIH